MRAQEWLNELVRESREIERMLNPVNCASATD
jgi:hypothetical protein